MKQIISKFSREDLPNEELRVLSDAIGINQVKVIMVKCPGMKFYIPKAVYKQSDLNFIRKHPNLSAQEIADRLGFGIRTAYRKKAAVK